MYMYIYIIKWYVYIYIYNLSYLICVYYSTQISNLVTSRDHSPRRRVWDVSSQAWWWDEGPPRLGDSPMRLFMVNITFLWHKLTLIASYCQYHLFVVLAKPKSIDLTCLEVYKHILSEWANACLWGKSDMFRKVFGYSTRSIAWKVWCVCFFLLSAYGLLAIYPIHPYTIFEFHRISFGDWSIHT